MNQSNYNEFDVLGMGHRHIEKRDMKLVKYRDAEKKVATSMTEESNDTFSNSILNSQN